MTVQPVDAAWDRAVLVCGKCSKKLGGGFGPKGKTALAKALRKHFGLKKRHKGGTGIIETKCLGLCPGGAVTVMNGTAAREWLVVPRGTDLDTLGRELGLTRAGAEGVEAAE